MIDFTSSLYLGMRHASATLRGWNQLTTGVPPALRVPAGSSAVAERLAALQGCETALLSPSTLHAFWDLGDALARPRASIHVDAGAYPIAAGGIDRARLRGVSVERFPHHDPRALLQQLARRPPSERPVIVADGFCAACGHFAPLASYARIARQRGGRLVIDDTQALGIFGTPAERMPYGTGGGGSLRRLGLAGTPAGDSLADDHVVVVASLAKAFGVPIAAISGARSFVAPLARAGATRLHSSGVSAAALRAAQRALVENGARGDDRRRRLVAHVRRLRRGLERVTIPASAGHFPLQYTAEMPRPAVARIGRALLRAGIRPILVGAGCGAPSPLGRIAFALHAAMSPDAIDAAVQALGQALAAEERREVHSAQERVARPERG